MKIIRDIVYDPSFAPVTSGDLYLPETVTEKTQVVLCIHGGGWCSSDRASFAGVAEFIAGEGHIAYNIDYRLTSQEPWPACGDDCLKAAAFLRHGEIPEITGADRRQIGVIGASAGGHLAMMTGLRFNDTAWLVSISGVLDPLPYLFNAHPVFQTFFGYRITMENLRTAFPEAYLDRTDPPRILCTHMLTDTVVPEASTIQFAATAAKRGVKVKKMLYEPQDGLTGHGIWIPGSDPHRLLPELEAEIRCFIKAGDSPQDC
jgi:acetyl esterase/lipase